MSGTSRWLAVHARLRPDQPALIHKTKTTSFRELEAKSLRLAAKLHGAGIGAGDRVAVLHANHAVQIELIHALILLEAVLVPLNTRLTTGELRGLLEDAEPTLLVHGPEFDTVTTDLQHNLPGIDLLPSHTLHSLPEKPATLAEQPRLERDQAILFTSGTTGRPKGVRLTLANHLASAAGSTQRLGTKPGDRWLACMPLHHIGGLAIVLRCAIDGMCVVLHTHFDAEAVLESIHRDAVTAISLVPTMLQRLLDAAKGESFPKSLRFVLLGGGPIPESLLARTRRADLPVAPSYGLTETASQVATLAPDEIDEHPSSAGRPLPGVKIRICDTRGRKQLPSTAGEVWVHGAQVMAGYLNHPDENARVLRDGWLRTGDIGNLSSDGYLSILDRRSDLIVSGGENIYPAEVEAALVSHPDVQEAAVIGRADPTWGQVVHAFIVRGASREPSPDELIAHCRSRLAGYKRPQEFHFVASLPRTRSGKLRRDALTLEGRPAGSVEDPSRTER